MSYLKLFRMSDMKKNHENENMTSKKNSWNWFDENKKLVNGEIDLRVQ